MKYAIAAFVAALSLSAVTLADEPPTTTTPPAKTRVGKTVYMPRKHVKIVRRFTPTSTPTPSYAYNVIAPLEAARWGADLTHLRNRISCETGGTWRYDAANAHSSARGFLQFLTTPNGGTWARALAVWDQHVKIREETSALVHKKVVIHYSDGSYKTVRGRLVRRRVTIVRRGVLPRWPSVYHGWANIRAGARALGGYGTVGAGEWSCG